MRFLVIILMVVSILGCQKEDPRANDFEITHVLKDKRWKSQWVEGTVQNLSTLPANKVKMKVEMYECNRMVDSKVVRIRETLFQNDKAEFCTTVGDTITRVEFVIFSVE